MLTIKPAWVILAVGVLIAAATGWAWQVAAETQQRQSFDLISSDVSARIATTLDQNMDLVATARALVETNPSAGNLQFVQFMTALDASKRYKDSVVVVYMQQVQQSQLNAFWSSIGAPVQGTTGSQQVSPPGLRPHYCLLRAGALQVLGLGIFSAGAAIPAGTDYCATRAAQNLLQSSAETGDFVVSTVQEGLSMTEASLHLPSLSSLQGPAGHLITTLFTSSLVIAPVYQLGLPVTTAAERLTALKGWALDVLNTRDIVSTALSNNHFGATLSYKNPGASPIAVLNTGASHAKNSFTETTHSNIDGLWTITIYGNSPLGGISPVLQGSLVSAGVLIITMLLFSLITVLGRSRVKALVMVEQKTSQLAHEVLHDALTGLPNRALILDRAELMIARANRESRKVGALFLDLDNFKAINDGLGHGAGDQLLQALSQRLVSVLRASDTVGRLGGDEFVILVEGEPTDIGPEAVADRMLEVLRQPYELRDSPGAPFTVTASIGVALGIRDSAEELLRDADLALYAAKAAGKNCSRTFRVEMQNAVADRFQLEMDLWTATDSGQLFLLYQPIVNLKHETISGVEALLRWRHPTRGVMAPELFLPIAEDTGLILQIGRWVLDEACRQTSEWHRTGHRLGISINISMRQLDSDVLVNDVRDALARSGLDPGSLTLEITETDLMRDTETTIRHLRGLKALGVRIAVDDFGTGYSSLAYLRQFPVDALKIDRTFIRGIANSTEAGALIHTMVQLGKALKLETLAEGIENRAQLNRLQREQCDTGQGFLFSQPIDANAIDQLLCDPRRAPESLKAGL